MFTKTERILILLASLALGTLLTYIGIAAGPAGAVHQGLIAIPNAPLEIRAVAAPIPEMLKTEIAVPKFHKEMEMPVSPGYYIVVGANEDACGTFTDQPVVVVVGHTRSKGNWIPNIFSTLRMARDDLLTTTDDFIVGTTREKRLREYREAAELCNGPPRVRSKGELINVCVKLDTETVYRACP